ncbi:glycoside hydrolase family 3 C-terminal domain-containing protein [Sphingomonas sp. BAUL-RG-20F-R05-02]|uniref:glycoside hydrolase family 3 C-terminal domain-containing protein n=1 Tax=Sphingomonas sp. BAUL-RG-20F-R05-02 TaxID=2914830 RepID=UPI001F582F78|nr:glycoside hydrolase family 3 C-terminal domain-containing protein [Sphingomonas sp. BAUL-RG-20F-R05-02]
MNAPDITTLPLDEQALFTAGASMWSTHEVPALGVRSITMADGPMGIASGRVDERDVSLLTPCPIALGASWDLGLIARVGALVGGDAVARGVQAVLAPNVNLARSPLAGRAFEYFSEDPMLTGVAGAAWATGLQSTGVASVTKHLVCNDSETQRDTIDIVVDERALREVYLLPFEYAAAAGAGGMLTAYNRVNGSWCAEQHHVITDIVKGEWGFAGVLMSDWFGTHTTAPTLNAGLDLEMPGPARFLGAHADAAVASGDVPQARVADAAARVATFAARFASAGDTTDVEDAEALLVEAAAAGFVLLRNNDDLLPLDPARAGTIAVIGPNAAAPCYQGGTFAKIAVKPDALRPLDAIRARFAGATILYEPGVDPQPRLPAMPVTPARDLGDGAVGMTLDYFDDDSFTGTPRHSETRATNSLVWFVGVHDQGAWDRPAGIRASGWYRPERDGEHIFYLGATGAVRMRVDGGEVLRHDETVAASDVMGRLKSGEADSVAVTLEAGRSVLVEVEFRHQPARVQGLWFGVRGPITPEEMLVRAVAAAEAADTVFLILGETSDASVESKDRADTRLPEAQLALAHAVLAANPRVVIVTNVGHAFDATFAETAPAFLVAWYPGQEFGRALAEVLAGDREPGGRLPVTLARDEADYPALALAPDASGKLVYEDGVRIGYRGLAMRGIAPLHGFGSGFGYTRFTLDAARIGDFVVHACVTNRSARAGHVVVQVYRHSPEFALVGFAKAFLAGEATGNVEVALEPRALRSWADGWQSLTNIGLSVGFAADDLPIRLLFDPVRA